MSEETTQNFPGDDLRGIHARFDSLDGRLDALDGRLTALEDKVDRRMQETRPIWKQVLAKLDGLETEMRRGFRRLDRHTAVLAGDVIAVRAVQHDLERRVGKLEGEQGQQ
jgi:hypothetical protein